ASWLEALPKHDWISYARMPIAVMIPRVLLQQAGIFGGIRALPSDFPGLDIISNIGDNHMAVYSWRGEKRSDMAVSMNPLALNRLKNAHLSEHADPVSSDIHLWFDAQQGYHMLRKLWQMAVKNRSIASWRRDNRIFRMQRLFGLQDKEKDALLKGVQLGHYFPSKKQAASVHQRMPVERGVERGVYSYGSAQSGFKGLPDMFFDIKRVDAYISVEENALYFENHIQLREQVLDQNNVMQVPVEQETETTLDFDE
ncbi:MAG: hypothetical protein HRU15_10505, partial [Planctomycetes bacterium]|nr:hypothetical protein [Planctomycetota bacterium]